LSNTKRLHSPKVRVAFSSALTLQNYEQPPTVGGFLQKLLTKRCLWLLM